MPKTIRIFGTDRRIWGEISCGVTEESHQFVEAFEFAAKHPVWRVGPIHVSPIGPELSELYTSVNLRDDQKGPYQEMKVTWRNADSDRSTPWFWGCWPAEDSRKTRWNSRNNIWEVTCDSEDGQSCRASGHRPCYIYEDGKKGEPNCTPVIYMTGEEKAMVEKRKKTFLDKWVNRNCDPALFVLCRGSKK